MYTSIILSSVIGCVRLLANSPTHLVYNDGEKYDKKDTGGH